MKKIIQLFAVVVLLPVSIQAQDLVDALRYSNFQVQGTARAGAMGNAFGALGGDFTSVSINPAGLGLYRTSEFVLTPSFDQTKIESTYLGSLMSDKNYNFSINNISYVASIPTQKGSESGIINVNIGIGYNRLKDFNSEMIAGTNNAGSSLMDYIAYQANEYNFVPDGNNNVAGSEYYEQLAWDSDLLLRDDNTGVYWHDLEAAGYGQRQRKSTSQQGSIDEFSLAIGLNFNHKLYIGASLGIVDVYYKMNARLSETDTDNSILYFNNMEFHEYLRTTGTGYNGKIGIIYKPINEIRLGASIHTPTFYNLHDNYNTSMYSSITYDDNSTENYSAHSPKYSEYDYDIETPMRATFSGAFIIVKKGLLSIDYELVDYGSASLRRGSDGYDFMEQNNEIAEVYRTVGNIRVGGEFRASDNISLRAGIEHYPSVYNEEVAGIKQSNANADLQTYSAGFGYKQGGFFFDIAYRYTDSDNYKLLYPDPIGSTYPVSQPAKLNITKNRVLFTIGFKF